MFRRKTCWVNILLYRNNVTIEELWRKCSNFFITFIIQCTCTWVSSTERTPPSHNWRYQHARLEWLELLIGHWHMAEEFLIHWNPYLFKHTIVISFKHHFIHALLLFQLLLSRTDVFKWVSILEGSFKKWLLKLVFILLYWYPMKYSGNGVCTIDILYICILYNKIWYHILGELNSTNTRNIFTCCEKMGRRTGRLANASERMHLTNRQTDLNQLNLTGNFIMFCFVTIFWEKSENTKYGFAVQNGCI